MARSLTHTDISEEIRDYFMQVDVLHSGTIDVKHLVRAVAASESASDKEIQEATTALDTKSKSLFSYSEFLAAMVPCLIKPKEAILRDAFRHFDQDSVANGSYTGRLPFQDFSLLFHSECLPAKIEDSDVASEGSWPALSASNDDSSRIKKHHRAVDRMKRWWLKFKGQLNQPTPVSGSTYQGNLLDVRIGLLDVRTNLLHGYPSYLL